MIKNKQTMIVKAKKHLGQHFLTDETIAKNIADTLNLEGYQNVLEIGPGMGVLTKYLLEKPTTTYVCEIDTESVDYLEIHYPQLHGKIIAKDFLKYNINEIFEGQQFAIIGNFPYNISTQIVLEHLNIEAKLRNLQECFKKRWPNEFAKKKVQKPTEYYRF